MMVLAGLPERSVMLLVSVRVRMLCEKVLAENTLNMGPFLECVAGSDQ